MKSLSTLIRKMRTFLNINKSDKKLLLEAFFLTGIGRGAILLISFSKIKKYLGLYKKESTFEIENEIYRIIKRVDWALKAISKHTPWESKCLVQALAAQRMLKKRKINSTLYLGVKKDKENNLLAHAWLRCGEVFVTGEQEKGGFVQVAMFSNEKLLSY
jgi:hypothetical protein